MLVLATNAVFRSWQPRCMCPHAVSIAQGTPAELATEAGASNLEDAFVALTGQEPGAIPVDEDEYDD